MGYEISLGDAYRDPRAHGKEGEHGPYGRPNSNHKRRLAIDLNLFKDGRFLTETEDHRPLGEWWEHEFRSFGAVWGGRFGDGNHYSFMYGDYM